MHLPPRSQALLPASPAHRLVINRLATRVLTGAADPQLAKAWLEPLLTGPMPRALGKAADALFAGQEGVIRIRRLSVRVRTEADLGGAALADQMAGAVIDALVEALRDARGTEVRVWSDPAAYRASYALFRLGLVDEPAWAFPDFQAFARLQGLEAARAVLETQGGTGILALCRALRQADQPTARLLQRLDPVTMRQLLAAGANDTTASPLPLKRLEALITAWRGGPASLSPLPRAFCIWIEAILEGDRPLPLRAADVSALADGALALAAIVRLVDDADGDWDWQIRTQLRAGIPPQAAVAGLSQAALLRLLADPELREALATFAAAHGHSPRADPAAGPREPITPRLPLGPARPQHASAAIPKQRAEAEIIGSGFAGVALILPLIAPLDLAAIGPPETLRLLALNALGLQPDDRRAGDPGLALLVPADPRRAGPPPPHPPPETAWRLVGNLGGQLRGEGSSALQLWSDLWLASFAARLPGLEDSSRGYLRRQFFHRSGRLLASTTQITVLLDPIPLGLVLRMAGMLGNRGPIPTLGGRGLVIELEESR